MKHVVKTFLALSEKMTSTQHSHARLPAFHRLPVSLHVDAGQLQPSGSAWTKAWVLWESSFKLLFLILTPAAEL